MAHNGMAFTLTPHGSGALVRHAAKAPFGRNTLPSVMFAPGRILSVREGRAAVVVDINSTVPVATPTGQVSAASHWGNATMLPDGMVCLRGGSGLTNELAEVAQDSEIWDLTTTTSNTAASAARPKLYHSSAILLKDGTVATGTGGSSSPLGLLDAEIYNPPYLFKRDGSGELFTRPRNIKAPNATLDWNQEFNVTITSNISRVTLVRNGAVTHAFKNETRFLDLPFSQTENKLSLRTPLNGNLSLPDFYMLFVWNAWGVPSATATVGLVQ